MRAHLGDGVSLPLFDEAAGHEAAPGSLGCAIEIAAAMAAAIEAARQRGLDRELIAARMGLYLGEKMSEATLNSYTCQAQAEREITLKRAMAFDAALGEDVLLRLYAQKRGGRRVVSAADAALIELGRIGQQEKALAERKRALQTLLKGGVA